MSVIDLRFVEKQREMPESDGVLYAVKGGDYAPLLDVRNASFPELSEGQGITTITTDEDMRPWVVQGVNDI